jgi:hypothetical protein
MRVIPFVGACLTLLGAVGCGGSKLVMNDGVVPPKAPVRLMATTATGSTELAAKMTEALANKGYGILDQTRTTSLLSKLDIENADITDPQILATLKARRIDAVLKIVAEMIPDHPTLLDKVRVTVSDTDGGQLLSSFDWTNSWGGMPNSPADGSMRMTVAEAATALAAAVARQLGAPGPKSSVYTQDLVATQGAKAVSPAPAAPAPKAEPSSDVDRVAPRGGERSDDFALVIGIDEYQSLPKADYGVRDAKTVRRHLAALGVPERNIISLEGSAATGGKLRSYLEQWLPRNVKPTSTVFVYYSGHGAPDPTNGDAYLVPWDADPMFLATTAYPLKQFYGDLTKLKAKRVIVALDSCFSGAGGRSVLAKGARPLVIKVDDSVPPADNLVVLAAASSSEITGTLDDQGHGIFTYYFLKGLSGAAKNGAGQVTPASLYDYLKPRVQDEARRQNREQTPTIAGGQNGEPL